MSFDITGFTRGAPCSEAEFDQAEELLGHSLLSELLKLYKIANGFRGPTNAAFLYPLLNKQTFNKGTTVQLTLYLRNDPSQPQFWNRAVAFGDDGVGATWGINLETEEIFEWWAEDGEEVSDLGFSVTNVWAAKCRWYDEVV